MNWAGAGVFALVVSGIVLSTRRNRAIRTTRT